MRQEVSLVATVLNEAASLEPLLASLVQQTRPPDELVIVDGGSVDGTLAMLERFAQSGRLPVRVLHEPGYNISQGRNAAIQAARGPIIAVMDAGVRLAADWLEHLVAPFEALPTQSAPDVVSGFFTAEPQSLFEIALGAVTLPAVEEINPGSFQPSSRSVAFRKSAWRAVGGYPEWLDYGEDLVFDLELRDAGYMFAFEPRALVGFRPRTSLRAFAVQYYRYARGDGKADLWRYRHLVRYGTYLVVGPGLAAMAIGHHPVWWLALALGALAMLRRPLQRAWPRLWSLAWPQKCVVLAWMPIIRVTGDLAKMVGYPAGIWWRWHHAPKQPWAKRQL